MTKRRLLPIICPLILATAAVFAEGCNTTEPPNRQLSDLQVTTRVKAKLASDIGASSLTNVDVTTTNGVVTLLWSSCERGRKAKSGDGHYFPPRGGARQQQCSGAIHCPGGQCAVANC